MSDEYYAGKDCRCAARTQWECSCSGVDWTEPEVYRLRAENAALREQIQILSGENRRLRQVVAAPAMISWAMHGKDTP